MAGSRGHGPPRIGLCVLVLAIVAGCAPARFRVNPQLQEKVASIKTVAIMPPVVKVYQLAVGGDTQLMEESTAAATQTVGAAIEKALGCRAGVALKPFPSPSAILDTSSDPAQGEIRAELEDTQALFEAVSASVIRHTYKHEGQLFPEKLKDFDYSLGPDVQRLAKRANADALLFISGVDHISTGGRKALMVVGTVVYGLLAGGQGGGRIVPPPGSVSFSVALVDATTGALLWYAFDGYEDFFSLTNPAYAADLAEWAFRDFPLGEMRTRKAREDDWSGLPTRGAPPIDPRTPC